MNQIIISPGDSSYSDLFFDKLYKKYFPQVLPQNLQIINPPTDNKKRTQYSVEDISKVLGKEIKKYETNQLFIFFESEKLTSVCQNFLLKTLEDSKHSYMFISSSNRFLSTFVSRCYLSYLDMSNSKFQGKINSTLPNLENISEILEVRRDKLLEDFRQSQSIDEAFAIPLEDMIKHLDANCKIESALYNFLWQTKQIK